jgi:hypothetical protein
MNKVTITIIPDEYYREYGQLNGTAFIDDIGSFDFRYDDMVGLFHTFGYDNDLPDWAHDLLCAELRVKDGYDPFHPFDAGIYDNAEDTNPKCFEYKLVKILRSSKKNKEFNFDYSAFKEKLDLKSKLFAERQEKLKEEKKLAAKKKAAISAKARYEKKKALSK